MPSGLLRGGRSAGRHSADHPFGNRADSNHGCVRPTTSAWAASRREVLLRVRFLLPDVSVVLLRGDDVSDDKAQKRIAVLVEDNPSLQKLTSLYLQRMNFAVEVVSDGAAALHKIEQVRPALVCLDLMLPRVSGYDVCEQLRARAEFSALPILILSARTTPEDRAHAEEVGANAFLAKPYKEQQFVAVVNKLLSGEKE